MIVRYALIMLAAFASVSYAGFDDSFIWKNYLSRPEHTHKSFSNDDGGMKLMFLHSKLYGIESLNWNYFSAYFNRRTFGLGLEFSGVGYSGYYQRNRYRMRIEYRINEQLKVAPMTEIMTEEFHDFGRYTGVDGEFYFNYTRRNFNAGIGVVDIQFKKPYERTSDERFRPFIFGSCIFEEGLMLSVGVRRFENRRTRWIFDQFISVNRVLALNFGYENNPSNIYGGLELTFRNFSLIFTYSSVSGLNDSVIWGISFRER